MAWEDPIVADVRRTREELSAKFSFDIAAIFADIRRRQEALGGRLVRLDRDQPPEKADATKRPMRSASNR